MTRQRVPLLACLVVLLVAACSTDGGGSASSPTPSAVAPTTASSAPDPGQSSAPSPGPTSTSPGQPAPSSDWRATYGWAVPSTPVGVPHRFAVPVAPPPAPPLPTLVEVRVGDHPAENFSRITFAFRGPTPPYQVAYVAGIEQDGSGDPVVLPGTAFLAVRFQQAQAHDEAGRSTLVAAPPRTIGYPTLLGWAPAGDFEGQVSVGLGLSGRWPVRLAESTRPDGIHVVSVDVRRG
ncbi:hypothetical protein [Micromonospora sp. NPDC049497]|uniref:AMIN-like domain-containing (lipo)protein n=1 Tax=Micromonospora sp. NPDC049497 TaxID=3364273 RepID=UPI0037914789